MKIKKCIIILISILILLFMTGCNTIDYTIEYNYMKVNLSASISTDTEIDYIKINWGDGSRDTFKRSEFDEIKLSHKYKHEGKYKLSFIIRESSGEIKTNIVEITVKNEDREDSFKMGAMSI